MVDTRKEYAVDVNGHIFKLKASSGPVAGRRALNSLSARHLKPGDTIRLTVWLRSDRPDLVFTDEVPEEDADERE